MDRGILFVMSGPSGTGKGTICKELLKNKDNNVYLSVSSTTRGRRGDEVDGETYNFTTVDRFKDMIGSGEMLEYAIYNGNYYGTPKKAVENALSSGRNVLLEIEVQGALKVKEIFPDAVLMFIIPPSMAELKKRLEERGREDAEQIGKRMETAKWEFTKTPLYSHIFVNDDLDECVRSIEEAIHQKTSSHKLIKKLLNEQY